MARAARIAAFAALLTLCLAAAGAPLPAPAPGSKLVVAQPSTDLALGCALCHRAASQRNSPAVSGRVPPDSTPRAFPVASYACVRGLQLDVRNAVLVEVDSAANGEHCPPTEQHCREEEPLLVSLLDGSLVALDPQTGSQLWTFDTGVPLVSVAQQDGDAPFSVLPGADGVLYAYKRGHAFGQSLEVCSNTIFCSGETQASAIHNRNPAQPLACTYGGPISVLCKPTQSLRMLWVFESSNCTILGCQCSNKLRTG